MARKLMVLSVILVVTAALGAAASSSEVSAGPSRDPGVEMVFVKGGCYMMGDTFGDGDFREKPVHEVCVSDFYLGKYEVTQAQWMKVMGNNPSEFKKCGPDCPVESVSWNMVQEYIGKLNAKTGRNYRLPTEAEWEYAARSGGKNEKWAGTNDTNLLFEYAWFEDDSTHPVGIRQPNGLGLYDMTGNVREWCQDWFDETYYAQSPKDNPQGPQDGVMRAQRGGDWARSMIKIRTSERDGNRPDLAADRYGFRLLLPAHN